MLIQVLVGSCQIDQAIDGRRMLFSVDGHIRSEYLLKHIFGLLIFTVDLVKHCLIVDNRAIGWVLFWKILLYVNFMVIQNLLGQSVLSETHSLREPRD